MASASLSRPVEAAEEECLPPQRLGYAPASRFPPTPARQGQPWRRASCRDRDGRFGRRAAAWASLALWPRPGEVLALPLGDLTSPSWSPAASRRSPQCLSSRLLELLVARGP